MRAAALALLVCLPGCGCESEITPPDRICVGPVQVALCGAPCDEDLDCGPELYCGPDDTCTAECSPGVEECDRDQYICGEHGRCVAVPFDAAPLADAEVCGSVDLNLSAQIPTVMLVIDQSSSMEDPFSGATSRWGAVKDALIDPDTGIVATMSNVIDFGATLYTSHNGDLGGVCPILVDVPPAADNFAAVSGLLTGNDPDDDTPTGEAIDAVVATMIARGNPRGTPQYIVLATDGEPDRCADPETQDGQAVSIAAAQNAFAQNLRMFILGVSGDIGAPHLQDLANAGAGLEVGGREHEPYYTADDAAQLATAFTTILGGLRSCVFAIDQSDGTIDLTAADQGEVRLNGRLLTYADEDGWRLLDGNTLELLGGACDEFRFTANVELTATFPCGAILE